MARVARPWPGVIRITFVVPGFASCGLADEWVWIFFGEPGNHRMRRNYTVRALRPEADEVDVDVVLHGGGLAVDWARAARAGDTLTWGEVSGTYSPPADVEWRLLAADGAGLPAPAGEGYIWMAGETRTVRAVRRHLRHERGVARERYSLTGYWLVGNEGWMDRYEQVAGELEAIWARTEVDGADVEQVMDEYEEALEDAGL